MALPSGTRLGPYQIETALGAGGMGEVYRARDTRLGRSVAVKVLAPEIAGDPAARTRFEREARAVAALDHPHICGLYDVGEADGTHYLVMPLLDGQTLAARLEKGPLPLAQALTIAAQMADGLDKAHRQGIVHRDLKPANVMLTKAGAGSSGPFQVKLLDFGLAKLRGQPGPISMSTMGAGATTSAGTAEGTILGTLHYMAPEQVEGREADARSDIWALGVVLYEMVTGVRPFPGDTPASVIGAILKDEPPGMSTRQALVPAALDDVTATCLAKDPDARWQSAADLRRVLQSVGTGNAARSRAVEAAATRPVVPWLLAAALLFAVLALLPSWLAVRRTENPALLQLSMLPPPGTTFSSPPASAVAPQVAVSPDGQQVAFVVESAGGRPTLWLRPLDTLQARQLRGTEDAFYPFWSPDSRSIGFFAEGKLKVVDLDGGPPRTVSEAAPLESRGAAWGADGTIVFAPDRGGLLRISAQGGPTSPATTLDAGREETTHRFPSFLPDGRRFLFSTRTRTGDDVGVSMASLDSPVGTPVIPRTAWAAQFAPPNHILFVRAGTLFAQSFDVGLKTTSGDPVALAEGVGATTTGYSAFSVSRTGVLVHARPIPVLGQLRWYDRNGSPGPPVGDVGEYLDFELSPDQQSLALSRLAEGGLTAADLYRVDLARNVSTRLTTHPMNDASPLWSPDGERLVFRSNRRGYTGLYGKRASGTDDEQLLLDTGASLRPTDWSSDGTWIIFSTTNSGGAYEIWAWRADAGAKPERIVKSRRNASHGRLSPDGKWLAYSSDDGGPLQVFVQPFPSGESRQLSPNGGSEPRWRRDGRELFYLEGEGRLMSVAVPSEPTQPFGAARPLFEVRVPLTSNPFRWNYAVTADGRRFLVNTRVEAEPTFINVSIGWTALLRGPTP